MSNYPPGIVKAIRFPVRRPAAVKSKSGIYTPERIGDEATGGTIQGVQIGSKEEYRVAVALSKLKIPFNYQVPIYGGRSRRGGQVIDFVLMLPHAQPLQVYGNYWHRNEMRARDEWNLARIEKIYKRPCWILWASDLQTQDATDQAIGRLL